MNETKKPINLKIVIILIMLFLSIIIGTVIYFFTNKNYKTELIEIAQNIIDLAEDDYNKSTSLITEKKILCEKYFKSDIYETCTIEFDIDRNAHITLIGKGKYKGINICDGTKQNLIISNNCIYEKTEEPTLDKQPSIENEELQIQNEPKKLSLNIILDKKLYEEENKELYKQGDEIALKSPVKEGYSFTGWKMINGDAILVDNKLKFGTTDVTIEGAWKINTYKIEYELNGGTAKNKNDYNIETENFSLESPVKEGYTFVGWSSINSDKKEKDVTIKKGTTGDRKFIANWIANDNTKYIIKHWIQNLNAPITENSNNYTIYNTEEKTGTTDSNVTPNIKTIEGFTSPKVQTAKILPDGSTIINYYYTRNSYKYEITNVQGVDTKNSTNSGTYQYGEKIILNAIIADGYAWNKWIISNSNLIEKDTVANTTFVMPAYNVYVTPSVSINTYKVEYDLNGGTVNAEVQTYYKYGETITLPIPIKTGYTFTGWTVFGKDASLNGNNLTIGPGDIILTANWDANTYYIKYNENNGSGTMTQSEHTYNIAKKLNKNNYQRTGYTFKGWNTKPDGTGLNYNDETEVLNLSASKDGIVNLYAQWNLINYTITLDNNGGTGTTNIIYTVETDTFTLEHPTQLSYKFTGWTGDNGETPQINITIEKGSVGNKNYVANWKLEYMYLYNRGESPMGNWIEVNRNSGGVSSWSTSMGAETINIMASYSGSYYTTRAGRCTPEKVDLTNVKTIRVIGNATSTKYNTSGSNAFIGLWVTNDKSVADSVRPVAQASTYYNGDFEFEINVESLSGSYYIIAMGSSYSGPTAKGTFSEIKLEMMD